MLTGRMFERYGHAIGWRLRHAVGAISRVPEAVRTKFVEQHVERSRLGACVDGAAKERVLVTLTSYPPRFSKLHLTIRSLLSQTVRPDAIELWVAEGNRAQLPTQVTDLETHGLAIRTCADLRSYKKIIPALGEDPARVIVTADDDVWYWPTWLRELLDARQAYPDDVLCHRAHVPTMTSEGRLAPYEEWRFEVGRDEDSVFPTGMGGVLYPPFCFDGRVTDTQAFMELCPSADDVWLFWMAALNGRRARKIGKTRRFTHWIGSQDTALYRRNLMGERANDAQIKVMTDVFGMPFEVTAKRAETGRGWIGPAG